MAEKHSLSSPPPATSVAEPSGPQAVTADTPKASAKPPRPNLRKIYALPAPIRTFPLPTFSPSNPLSLLHLAYAWAKQVFSTHREPWAIHEGIWSPELGTVIIRDPASIRALWEQGFYGKGHLSRSEPNWFKAEQVRQGLLEDHVSEMFTAKRREDRKMMKWERARVELEAIRQTRLEEATKAQEIACAEALVNAEELGGYEGSANGGSPPVGPLQLLALPNSHATRERPAETAINGVCDGKSVSPVGPMQLLALPNSIAASKQPAETAVNGVDDGSSVSPVGPLELLALPNSLATPEQPAETAVTGVDVGSAVSPVGPMQLLALPNSIAASKQPTGAAVNGAEVVKNIPNGTCLSTAGSVAAHIAESPCSEAPRAHPSVIGADPLQLETASAEDTDMHDMKAQKSVRFSPEVRSTTVDLSNPPSPELAAVNGKPANGESRVTTVEISSKDTASHHSRASPDAPVLVDKEHLQLTREEAFFLTFALGTLSVTTPSQSPISNLSLLNLFRAYSYNPPSQTLSPDDTFLTQYVTYHHFRSLGFTPRPGIKFAVDWLLYLRGPVFDHAEYGVVVVPSYSHPYWKSDAGAAKKRSGGSELSWSWLHGASRTLSHAVKTIVIAYVDVPPPAVFEEALGTGGVVDVLGLYSVREVIIKRFSPNRNRNG